MRDVSSTPGSAGGWEVDIKIKEKYVNEIKYILRRKIKCKKKDFKK